MDSSLKLQIMTALDNAGIKATEAQINGLANTIKNFNKQNSGQTDKVAAAIGEMPGRIGKIGKALGGISAKITLIIGALIAGYDFGKKHIVPLLREHWKWYDNIYKNVECLKKEQERGARVLERQGKVYLEIINSNKKLQEQQTKAHDNQLKNIESESRAYIQQINLRNNLLKHSDNAELLRLDREEFEDELKLTRSGASQEELDQLHAQYDVLRKQLTLKQTLYQFDEKSDELKSKAVQKEKELAKTQELYNKTNANYKNAVAEHEKAYYELDSLEHHRNTFIYKNGQKAYDQRIKILRDAVKAAYETRESLKDTLDVNKQKVEAAKVALSEAYTPLKELDITRATLQERLSLDLDKAATQYDKLISQNGNVLGLEFNKDFAESLNNTSVQSYNELKEITQNTNDLARKLDELLGLKKGF